MVAFAKKEIASSCPAINHDSILRPTRTLFKRRITC
jgi:hypothetical protein